MQSHICDLAHTLQQGSNSSNTVYCIILFLLLSASSEHLSMFPKHKNIMIVTAAVSPVWYKAEQQYSVCLSKAHKSKVEFAVFLNCKSFFQILCKVDSSRPRSGSGYETDNCLLLPKAQGTQLCPHRAGQLCLVVLFWARRPPFLFPQGASCSGARLSP